MLPGCSTDPVQQAYEDCLAQVDSGAVEAEGGVGNATMKGMIEGIEEMAESACGMILSTCEADRESTMCRDMISEYSDGDSE